MISVLKQVFQWIIVVWISKYWYSSDTIDFQYFSSKYPFMHTYYQYSVVISLHVDFAVISTASSLAFFLPDEKKMTSGSILARLGSNSFSSALTRFCSHESHTALFYSRLVNECVSPKGFPERSACQDPALLTWPSY